MKYHKLDNRKFLLNLDKPFTKGFHNNNNQNRLKYNLNLNHLNHLNTKNYQNKIRNIYTPIKTYNNLKNKNPNEIIKTSPIKYQYRKIPFQKVKGFKFKLVNNNFRNKTNINCPIICAHNNSTIQNNLNNNIIKDNYKTRMETINQEDNVLNFKNKITKPIYHQIIETKSSSLGSKYETREESAHFLKSKTSLNNKEKNIIKNFSFLKFEKKRDDINISNISPEKKLLKYINKAIKQLNKIKILITNKEHKKRNLSLIQSRENLHNKNIRIDLSLIGKNLKKYKNVIDIDNNKINLSFERKGINNNNINYNHIMKRKKNKTTFKKLNKTITYDELKSNYKKGHKGFSINKINKIEYINKYNTINTEDKYKIKSYDTEIKIPKIDINNIKKKRNYKEINLINEDEKEFNNKKRLKDRYKTENDGENNYNNEDNKENGNNTDNNTNTDIANFEFSD